MTTTPTPSRSTTGLEPVCRCAVTNVLADLSGEGVQASGIEHIYEDTK